MTDAHSPLKDRLAQALQPYLAMMIANRNFESRHGISLSQIYLLLSLQDLPGISAGRLAKQLGIQASSLTLAVDRMKQKGFVDKISDPKDLRKQILFITKKGKSSVEKVLPKLAEVLKKLES